MIQVAQTGDARQLALDWGLFLPSAVPGSARGVHDGLTSALRVEGVVGLVRPGVIAMATYGVCDGAAGIPALAAFLACCIGIGLMPAELGVLVLVNTRSRGSRAASAAFVLAQAFALGVRVAPA